MGTAIATMAKRDKLDSIDIVSPFSLHAYDDEDEREDRDADDGPVWLPSTLKRERETEFSSTPQTTKSTEHLTRKTTAPTRAVTPMVAGSPRG